jgi:type I restriction-modification system DNA methylase subunit
MQKIDRKFLKKKNRRKLVKIADQSAHNIDPYFENNILSHLCGIFLANTFAKTKEKEKEYRYFQRMRSLLLRVTR